MKPIWKVVALVTLSGCVSGPLPIVHKEGTTLNQRSAVYDHCQIASFKDVPQVMTSETIGGYDSPGTIQCNTIGSTTYCNTVGAIHVPPRTMTYDVNQPLRDRYISRCIAAQGYSIISKPVCTSKKDADAYRAVSDRQPSANAIKCVPEGTF
jgi:hypothetical protein